MIRWYAKKIITALLLSFCLIAGGTSTKVQAADTQSSSSSVKNKSSFSVQAIIPKEQEDQNRGFFDLTVQPNEVHEVGIRLFNTGTEKITVTVAVNNAYTSNSGAIAYDKHDRKLYDTASDSMADLVQGKRRQVVTLEPNGIKEVKFKIKAPETQYQGMILGAITATGATDPAKKQQITINNRIAYSLGIVYREGDFASVTPKFKVGKATPKIIATQQGISLELENSMPINASKMSIHTEFYKNGKRIKEIDQSKLEMAPYSYFKHFIPITLSAGSYKITGKIQSENGGYQTFTKHFNITKTKEAKKTVAKPVVQKKNNIGLIVLFIALGIIVLAIVWIAIYYFAMASGKKKRSARKARRTGDNRRSSRRKNR
ncbi:WxL protein peptidoglycan domain-containing protein [Agrilactobacillus yilanensis]|uniref:WxL protein peptidoglycan domain-containing protein n=1 Tax=Agrilactobacillus yilanensis TaxID=2485997 RepID=A0ABW4JA81_9LACO|nr:DUF916 domain-containing protein [Agrilactobacillus yilanensis]